MSEEPMSILDTINKLGEALEELRRLQEIPKKEVTNE
jgi:hypothetical protein